MTQYIGRVPQGIDSNRYFYALRRSEDGTLYINRVDISSASDSIDLFIDPVAENLADKFDLDSVEYYDGRSATTRELVDENLRYEQWRWDKKFISYYIDADGEFIASVGENRTYPEDV